MIYVDENEPEGDPEAQFNHRKVTIKRQKDVRGLFEMLGEIGRGKFGRVLKCKKKDGGQIFAAKFVTCTRREDRRNVEREIDIMNSLKSPKLLQLFDAYDNGRNEMCLITEYIGGGELFDRVIDEEFVLSERACRVFMKQILEGVSYIHRNQIIHLDLKPENILCLTRTGNRIKIIDFGLARKFEPMKKLQILFGTPEFVAPEVVNFEPIGYYTDMWALGVICYVLVSGLSPFMGDTDLETMANVTIAEYDYEDEAFDKVSDLAKQFIDDLLVKDKNKRSTADQCLQHPWLSIPQNRRCSQGTSLSSAKDNLNQQKAAWNNRDSCYYLFDSTSKTASQLYEANVCFSPQLLEKLGYSEPQNDEFSFFTPDGEVRRKDMVASDVVTVNTEEEHDLHKSDSQTKLTVDTDRKRALKNTEDATDEAVEYVGLVKRPKTPLITASDIRKKAEQMYERKHSNCGSLPDIVPDRSSSDPREVPCEDVEEDAEDSVETVVEVEVGEDDILNDSPEKSLRMLLGETVRSDDPDAVPAEQVKEDDIHEELPLPDVIKTEDAILSLVGEVRCPEPVPALSNERLMDPERTPGDQADLQGQIGLPDDSVSTFDLPSLDDQQTSIKQGVTKTYTVESGFERPAQGWNTSTLDTVDSCFEEEEIQTSDSFNSTNINLHDEAVQSDAEDVSESTESSSLPSESSGIFYRAEYTPPISAVPPPDINSNLISAENCDPYWKEFFARNSLLRAEAGNSLAPPSARAAGLSKTRSSCDNVLPPPRPPPPRMNRSKSDAKIHYQNSGMLERIEGPFGLTPVNQDLVESSKSNLAADIGCSLPCQDQSEENRVDNKLQPNQAFDLNVQITNDSYQQDLPQLQINDGQVQTVINRPCNPDQVRQIHPSIDEPSIPCHPADEDIDNKPDIPEPAARENSAQEAPSDILERDDVTAGVASEMSRDPVDDGDVTGVDNDSPNQKDICDNSGENKIEIDESGVVVPRRSTVTRPQGLNKDFEQISSDKVSSTISREMQDLLVSIKALSGPAKEDYCVPRPIKENGAFNSVMNEVEANIRFSATKELLERIESCPDIHHLYNIPQEKISLTRDRSRDAVRDSENRNSPCSRIPQIQKPYPATKEKGCKLNVTTDDCEESSEPSKISPTPDLLRFSNQNKTQAPPPWMVNTKFKQDPPQRHASWYNDRTNTPLSLERQTPLSPDRGTPLSPERGTSLFSDRGTPLSQDRGTPLSPERGTPLSHDRQGTMSPCSPGRRRRFTSLPRPSDMPSAQNQTFKLTGHVPDMLARVSNGYEGVALADNQTESWRVQGPSDRSYLPRPTRFPDTLSNGVNHQLRKNSLDDNRNYANVRNNITEVRMDLYNLRDVISCARDDISTSRQPLLEIFDDLQCAEDAEKKHILTSSNQTYAPLNQGFESNTTETMHTSSRRLFSSANKGSVSKTKDKFEQKSSEVPIRSQGVRGRGATPLSSARSPSPIVEKRRKSSFSGFVVDQQENSTRARSNTGTRTSLKKRSPSPVVTGKVSSFRNRFESIPTTAPTQTLGRSTRIKLREPHEVMERSSSITRLPAHYIPLESSTPPPYSSNRRPSVNRAVSLRSPGSSETGDITSVREAVDYLRCTLPKKSSKVSFNGAETRTAVGQLSDRSNIRTPFGFR